MRLSQTKDERQKKELSHGGTEPRRRPASPFSVSPCEIWFGWIDWRAVESLWWPGCGATFTTTDGITLVGDGYGDPAHPPVLLMHGGGQTRHAWGGTARALARHGWYAVCVDLRGHGDSDWSPDGNYSIDVFARDMVSIARAFDRPPALVGASLSGLAALIAQGEAEATVLVGAGAGRRHAAPRSAGHPAHRRTS